MKICPDCSAEMVEGCRRDKFNAMTASPESWVANEPKKQLPFLLGHKERPIPVVTYACVECGRLVSYLKRE